MTIELHGLTEFQKDLLVVAQQRLPRETFKAMRKVGNRATTHVRRQARGKVNSVTGNYYKGFKRGKVFKDADGKIVVRVINGAPHAHLIEDGHRMVTRSGVEYGFRLGKKVMSSGIESFDSSGDFDKYLGRWLDDMLRSGNL
ncbi:HK97 gp10 family phage protein [Streptococcus mutans]|nr:HK97 gp10 family phage protein [Streptococcus mutans]MCB5145203.1 HK97 gp10 family phage protein [Streptococcus mutans]